MLRKTHQRKCNLHGLGGPPWPVPSPKFLLVKIA